jgi:hypothetical protein
MKPTLPLRIASGLSLVFAAGHIAGGLKSWSPVGETQVLRDMGRFHFEVGSIRELIWIFILALVFSSAFTFSCKLLCCGSLRRWQNPIHSGPDQLLHRFFWRRSHLHTYRGDTYS